VNNKEKKDEVQNALQFNFLKDAPINKESQGFFDFYHNSISPALKSILENETCVHTIGLFGRWGTGKSTIIKLLKDEGVVDGEIIEFDAWKYEKDSLRRQLLLQIAKDLDVSRKEVSKLEKELYFSVSKSVEDDVSISWGHLKKVGLLSLAFLIPIGFITWQVFPDFQTQWKLWIGTSFSLVLSVALILEKVLGDSLKKIIMVSPITRSKSQLSSPEQFERSFVKILKLSKTKAKRIIIVIDNLDRVDSKVATQVLSTLKTFLEIEDVQLNGKNVVFLVPCDFEAIKKSAPSSELADEFLRKIFNLTVWTPEYIDTDIRTFTKEQIKETGDIKKYIDNDDVYLVIESAFSNNPREIKQFINNLISAVLVSFNTEVREIVKNNIAYMAKVLVLMHKYPEAFQNLKKSWYAPEEIITTYKELISEDPLRKQFENFMLQTSRITVDDAEPFIYLKKPVISEKLKDDESIRLSLIEGNETEAKTHIESETDKGVLLEFVISILNKYKNHSTDIITIIFKTQLGVLGDLQLSSRDYVNTVANLLDGKVWPSFQKLQTNIVFDFIIADTNLDSRVRRNLLDRYVLALSTTEEFKNLKEIEFVKTLIQNLINHRSLLSSKQKTDIAQAIEENYASRDDLIDLFSKIDDKKQFLTKRALEQTIETTIQQNFNDKKNLFVGHKDLLVEMKLFTPIFIKITESILLQNQTEPGFTDAKELFLKDVLDLFIEFKSELNNVSQQEKEESVRYLIQTFNAISPWENKKTVTLILLYLRGFAEETQKNQIVESATQFLLNSNEESVRAFSVFWTLSYTQKLISEFLPKIQQRILTQPDFAKTIYEYASDDTKLEILDSLITKNAVEAIKTIDSLSDKDYARAEVMERFLKRSPALGITERREIYNFVSDKINKNDDVSIKELVSDQIKELINQDNLERAEVGYDFFSKANFLGVVKKRDVIKSVLEFLRQPGKIIAPVHSYALRAVTGFFEELQETLQKDYIYSLFSMIRDGVSQDVLELSLNNLLSIKPSFTKYKKDYEDLSVTLESWNTINTKRAVVDLLLQLKPKGLLSSEAQKYWKKIGSYLAEEE
jgi:hypothetical protein